MIIPGVQNPHCRPCCSQNAFWSGCSPSAGASPSIVVIVDPSTWTASMEHDLTARPSSWTVHAPHWLVSQPTWVPVSPRSSRSAWTSNRLGSTSTSPLDAVHRERDVLSHHGCLLPRCAGTGR